MDGLRNFGGLQAIEFGGTLVVSFQLLPLVLEVRCCGRRNMNKR